MPPGRTAAGPEKGPRDTQDPGSPSLPAVGLPGRSWPSSWRNHGPLSPGWFCWGEGSEGLRVGPRSGRNAHTPAARHLGPATTTVGSGLRTRSRQWAAARGWMVWKRVARAWEQHRGFPRLMTPLCWPPVAAAVDHHGQAAGTANVTGSGGAQRALHFPASPRFQGLPYPRLSDTLCILFHL